MNRITVHPRASARRRFVRGVSPAAAGILLLLAGCSAQQPPPPESPVRPPRREARKPSLPPAAPTRPAEPRRAPTPVGQPPEIAAIEEPMIEPEAPPRTPTSVEPDSVLSQVGPGTPPHVATALRLVEDGRQKMDRGDYEGALDVLERAVNIDPANPYGYYFLARVHHLKKNYDQAVAFANRAAVLSAGDQVWRGRAYCLQGAAYEEVGRYSDARRAYQKAMEADPNNITARVGTVRLSGTQ